MTIIRKSISKAHKLLLLGAAIILSGCSGETLQNIIGSPSTVNGYTPANLVTLMTNVINVLAGFSSIVAIVVMIAAYQLLASAGDQAGQTRAKDTIRYAAYGLLLVVFSYAIVRLLFAILAPEAVSILGATN